MHDQRVDTLLAERDSLKDLIEDLNSQLFKAECRADLYEGCLDKCIDDLIEADDRINKLERDKRLAEAMANRYESALNAVNQGLENLLLEKNGRTTTEV